MFEPDNSFHVREVGCEYGIRFLTGGECTPLALSTGDRAWLRVDKYRRDAVMNPYASRVIAEAFGNNDSVVYGPFVITASGLDNERQYVEHFHNYLAQLGGMR